MTGRRSDLVKVQSSDEPSITSNVAKKFQLTRTNWSAGMETGVSTTARTAFPSSSGGGGVTSPAFYSQFDTTIKTPNKASQAQNSSDLPNMMWNINDVHVGYDAEQAKRFKLEGCDTPAPLDVLPTLRVDIDLPYYMKCRRQTQNFCQDL